MVHNDIKISPRLELSLPVAKCRQRNDDKERASNAVIKNVIEKGNTLYSLAKTHFIRQYTVLPRNTYTIHVKYLIVSSLLLTNRNNYIQIMSTKKFLSTSINC